MSKLSEKPPIISDKTDVKKFDFNAATPEEIRLEAQRREDQRNGVISVAPAQAKRQASLLEREVQERVIRLYVRHGCKVRVYSQPRKAKYMTPGGADLQIFSPVGLYDDTERPRRVMWYHETKRPKGGVFSDDQLLFAADCREARIDVLGGGTEEAQAHLDWLNITLAE